MTLKPEIDKILISSDFFRNGGDGGMDVLPSPLLAAKCSKRLWGAKCHKGYRAAVKPLRSFLLES